jgi:hypothetical protein
MSVVLVIVVVAIIVIESKSAPHLNRTLAKDRLIKPVACDDLAACQFQDHTDTAIFLPNGASQ